MSNNDESVVMPAAFVAERERLHAIRRKAWKRVQREQGGTPKDWAAWHQAALACYAHQIAGEEFKRNVRLAKKGANR